MHYFLIVEGIFRNHISAPFSTYHVICIMWYVSHFHVRTGWYSLPKAPIGNGIGRFDNYPKQRIHLKQSSLEFLSSSWLQHFLPNWGVIFENSPTKNDILKDSAYQSTMLAFCQDVSFWSNFKARFNESDLDSEAFCWHVLLLQRSCSPWYWSRLICHIYDFLKPWKI